MQQISFVSPSVNESYLAPKRVNPSDKQLPLRVALDNVDIEFEKEALIAIAKLAKEQKTGARGIRGIMETLLKDLMFETPSDVSIEKIIIKEETVTNGAQPEIIRSKQKSSIKIDIDISDTKPLNHPKNNAS